MPRGAPPPHEGPCRKCGGDDDVTKLGRYRGLCAPCRKIEPKAHSRPEPRAAGDGLTREDFESKRPSLSGTCRALTKRAEKLEKALADRKAAHVKARTELALFKESLQAVGRVAQSLVNGSTERDSGE